MTKLALVNPDLAGADKLLQECLDTGWISSQGPFVRQFEQQFAEWLGVRFAISCSNGTAALHLSLAALNIRPRDVVIVPSFTFIATANSVLYCNAMPKFWDIDDDTWCMTLPEDIKTDCSAIMPVHINGYPCDMEKIMRVARMREAKVVEDACQSLGSVYQGKNVGTIGDIGCFSFFANKVLTTGEGGMVVTNDEVIAQKVRTLRDHGRTDSRYYVHDTLGFNYRMTNLQAAVGLAQLPRLDQTVVEHKRVNDLWRQSLGHTQPAYSGQCPWLYHYRLPSQDRVALALSKLSEAGIEAKPFYKPVHRQRPYRAMSNGLLPVTDNLFGVILPIHHGVKREHIETVKRALS